jgi:hypothetical protein
MTAERRLAAIEASLSPTELVLRWLAEAHTYDDFKTYSESLFDADPSNLPMDRLAREAQTSARSRCRGQPKEDIATAVRKALVETIFRAQLVLRINALAQDVLDREILIHGALSAFLALTLDRPRSSKRKEPVLTSVQVRDVLFARISELLAVEAARTAVEARYLGGAMALFPAAQRAWTEQLTASQRMAVIALGLTERDGATEAPSDDPEAFDARVAQLVADHVEPARSKAYDDLGEGRRALSIAIGWLRPNIGSVMADPNP